MCLANFQHAAQGAIAVHAQTCVCGGLQPVVQMKIGVREQPYARECQQSAMCAKQYSALSPVQSPRICYTLALTNAYRKVHMFELSKFKLARLLWSIVCQSVVWCWSAAMAVCLLISVWCHCWSQPQRESIQCTWGCLLVMKRCLRVPMTVWSVALSAVSHILYRSSGRILMHIDA